MTPSANDWSSKYLSNAMPHYCSHDMQFYDRDAGVTMSLNELEKSCVDRLLILGVIFKIHLKNERSTADESRKKLLRELRKREEFTSYANLCEGKGNDVDTIERRKARTIDNISHNMIRLIFAREEKTREWFAKMEKFFFLWRLEALDANGILSFRRVNDMIYPTLDDDEKKSLKIHLAPLMLNPLLFDSTIFYRVPAIDVLSLIKKRNVYFERGTAYIEEIQFRSLIYHHFVIRFSSRLKKSIVAHNYMTADERLEFIGKRLRKIYETLQPIAWNPHKISINDLDELAETSYPPCMRKLHEALKKKQHLRNGGRLQYTLFLKTIGLSAEQTLEFYKKIFTKKFTEEIFEKQYAYQFRHMYGLVGSRKNYELPNCCGIVDKMISGPDEYHGCFFVTEDIEDLGKKLETWKILSSHIGEISQLATSKQYGRACSAYFQAIHDSPISGTIVNPRDFFGQSRKIRKSSTDDDPFCDEDITG